MEQNEILKQAMQASTPEELLALAKERGMELTGEQAKAYFDRLHQTGELSDEELGNVSGGCGRPKADWICRNCGDVFYGYTTKENATAEHQKRHSCYCPDLVDVSVLSKWDLNQLNPGAYPLFKI